jgi:hypothetical protein
MIFPKHLTFSIEHNPHKNCYETIEQYLETCDHFKHCISDEVLMKCCGKSAFDCEYIGDKNE